MRFRFQLEPVLKLREREEDARIRDVARLEHQRIELEGRVRRCQEQIRGAKHSVREGLSGSLDLAALRGEAAGTMGAMRSAQGLVLELASVHGKLDGAREALREAARARRAVELLRERRFAEWKRAQTKAEQIVLDEAAPLAMSAGLMSSGAGRSPDATDV